MTRTELSLTGAVASATGASPSPPRRRLLALGVATLAGSVLGGCAALRQVSMSVGTFGRWPAGRAPGRWAFDRLPSQAQGGAARDRLELLAGPSLEKVGFSPARSADAADVLVQLDWREGRMVDPAYEQGWPAPGWRVGIGYGGRSRGAVGLGWGWGPSDPVRDEQELRLLLIDRASRQVLVEVRVRHEGRVAGDDMLPLMLDAALQGFPDLPAGERRVTGMLP